MPPQPDLPEPAHHNVDSMLARKFGKETANYFSGSPLNRVSFLRSDHAFISAALTSPSTAFLLLDDLAPLAKDHAHLAFASHDDVRAVIGENPFAKTEQEMVSAYDSSVQLPLVIFLGLDERRKDAFVHKEYRGVPYFAVDITPRGPVQDAAKGVVEAMKAKGLIFLQGRDAMSLNAPEAAIFAQARALLDWNLRNPFCASCGQPTLSVNAGTKRLCPSTDFAGASSASSPRIRPDCPSRKGVSNVSFPRTDPTVIMAVLSHDSRRVLLGRQHRWPPHFYSTLAGFLEPAESVEEAVRREVWEESGVKLGRVVIHSTQPWPYPANLMIGAIGQALEGGEDVHLGHDPELEDAKWFDLDTLRRALATGTRGLDQGPEERIKEEGIKEERIKEEHKEEYKELGYKEADLRLPPKTAIANQLLQAVVGGFLGGEVKI